MPVFRPRDLLTHHVDDSGELILHDPASGQMAVLNAVGAAAYELLDGTRSADAVAAELRAVFTDVPGEQIDRDVKLFFEDLLNRGLVQQLPPP